ncbi:MAG TPA: aminotransferase class V-fold PLP-dependent enzyme, partial [Pirellulales bacterium]
RPLPYNRTADFSATTLEILDGLKVLFDTQGEVVILTSSGTGAMEAAVASLVAPADRALVIDAGVFGHRWGELCAFHGIQSDSLSVSPGMPLDIQRLEARLQSGAYDVLLATAHETSTGSLYDMAACGELADRYGVLFVVDAISSIGADAFHMDRWHVDAAVLSSQKALALPPGLSFLALSPRAVQRLAKVRPRSMYFDLSEYLRNQVRGQMPYTPAIGLFLLLEERLREIRQQGREAWMALHAQRASHFRSRLGDLPFELFSRCPSQALTALRCRDGIQAEAVVAELAEQHGLVVAPNGGAWKTSVFRVAHFGEQSLADLDLLLAALADVVETIGSAPPCSAPSGSTVSCSVTPCRVTP